MKYKILILVIFTSFILNAQTITNDYYNNGINGCNKCYKGYISKNRKCDNCNGFGDINFSEICDICNGNPGGCKESDNCNGDCHVCYGTKIGDINEVTCKACGGSGRCKDCKGQGHIYGRDCRFCKGNGNCPAYDCRGTGKVSSYKYNCPACNGSGNCTKKYPTKDSKCHGKGEIHYTIEKNPRITQNDINELQLYITEIRKEESIQKFEKGNEFFNLLQFEDALKYYNQSLNLYSNSQIEIKKQQVLGILDSIKTLGDYNFNYLEFPKSGINNFKNKYKEQLFNYYVGPSTTCKVTFTSNGQGKLGLRLDGIQNKALVDSIIAKPFGYYPNPASKYGYYVNATHIFEYNITSKTSPVTFKIKQGIVKVGSKNIGLKSIKSILPDSIDGKYTFNIGTLTIDGETKPMTPEFTKFKSFGGPNLAYCSIIIPGLGKSLITRSSKGIKTLLYTGGFAAIDMKFYTKANNQYDMYMNATTQDDMDLYYSKYSNNMIGAKLFFGTAAVIWLYDIYTVYHQGKLNKYKENKLTPSISINQFQKSLNVAININ